MIGTLRDAVVIALDRIIDPCSVGRGVPAGLQAMGMVKRVEVDGDTRAVRVTLRLTSPACHFQTWFFDRVRQEVLSIPTVEQCSVSFSKDFDWSDSSMSPDLRERLRQGRIHRTRATPSNISFEKGIQSMPITTNSADAGRAPMKGELA